MQEVLKMEFQNYNPYAQQFNNYQPRMPQYQQQIFQQQQIQPQIPTLSGRAVNDFNEVTANDVPMNGSIAIFPKADYSEIEARQWNSNGTISKIVFKPIQIDNPNNDAPTEEKSKYEEISKQLDGVFSRLDELFVAVGKLSAPKGRTVAKKEADE